MSVDLPVRRAVLARLVVLAAACALVVGLSACGSSDNGSTAQREAANSALVRQHPKWPPGQKPCHKGDPEGHTNPAKILGSNSETTQTAILLPWGNVWTTGDCRQVTDVEAGAAGWHASAGIFVISRIRGSSARGRYIVVPNSGAVTITRAPLGPKVVTWAQKRGELQFKSKRGLTGTLNLSDDTATLSTGAVIQPTNRPFSGAG